MLRKAGMSTTSRSAPESRVESDPATVAERQFADFWTAYVDSGHRGVGFLVRHPLRLTRMVRGMSNLPVVEVAPSDTDEGRAVRDVLVRPGPLRMPSRWFGTAVLEVPQDPDAYLMGRRAQTLRRKIRSAQKLGVRCELVTDPAERVALVERAEDSERRHANPLYRSPAPDNKHLLRHHLWIKAVDETGDVLLLAVAPVDGRFATLRYFRTLGASPAHTDSRYLATYALVRELSQRGVTHLLDTEPPGAQTNGLRHFQRMLGFRYVRMQLRRGSERVPAVSAWVACASLEPCIGVASFFPMF